MRPREYDRLFKVLIIGDSGVGKSSILLRFTDDVFQSGIGPTVGVDFRVRTLPSNEKRIKLQIWDTAGQERFRSITRSYYRGAHGIIIVYDITSMESFENVKRWLNEVKNSANSSVCKLLVGNKCDETAKRQVQKHVAEQFAESVGMTLFEVSALDATSIDEVFHKLITDMLVVPEAPPKPPTEFDRLPGMRTQNEPSGSRCC